MTQYEDSSRGAEGLRLVSLFSGCGGLDLGFAQCGYDIAFASDHDPAAVATYNHNLGHQAQLLDVRESAFASALREIDTCDVLLGGFPCQGFSKAGPKRESDDRNLLYKAMIEAMITLAPRVFVAENVDGLAQNFNGAFLHQIIEDCANAGYRVEYKTLDAAWFGVPQHRRRILIVGVRKDLEGIFRWPLATRQWVARNGERAIHTEYPNWAKALEAPATLKDAFAGLGLDSPDHDPSTPVTANHRMVLERVPEGRKLCNARHDQTSVRTWDIPEVFGPVSSRERGLLESVARNRRHKKYGSIPNGNPLSIEVLRQVYSADLSEHELDSLVERSYLKRVGDKWDLRGAMFASGLYRRPPMDQPSPTVLTSFGNPRFYAHPRESRPFTVREAARLQTFSDEYRFDALGVSSDDAFRLIGNAVPPLLAKQIAVAVSATLRIGAGQKP